MKQTVSDGLVVTGGCGFFFKQHCEGISEQPPNQPTTHPTNTTQHNTTQHNTTPQHTTYKM